MIHYPSIPARYVKTGVKAYDGHPLIEALPILETSKDDILRRIEFYPPPATESERRKSDLIRISELSRIGFLVYPLAEYRRGGFDATQNIREAYVGRNPATAEDQRRRALIAADHEDCHIEAIFGSTARGQTILGVSGSGKTTFGARFFEPYCVVIEHVEYNGCPLRLRQIPCISLAVPHDATLKSFCLQFFETVDAILGNTRYLHEAMLVRSVANMARLLRKVATAISLGTLFIDELQNLRAAKGDQAEIVLNLFSQIIDLAGVSVVVAGTPAVEAVISKNVRNIRKLTSGGCCCFPVMRRGDPQWRALCECYWPYQFVRRPTPLTEEVLDGWHGSSGGNPAFTALSFALAQRQEIGEREVLDAISFQRVLETDMCLLKPAIQALLSGKATDLQRFDDLLFRENLLELRDAMGWPGDELPAGSTSSGGAAPRGTEKHEEAEFDELKDRSKEKAKTKERRPMTPGVCRAKTRAGKGIRLPVVDPLH